MRKLDDYITDSISERKYDNIDEIFSLVIGELIGVLVVHVVAFLLAMFTGDITAAGMSGWSLYVLYWLLLNVIYIIAVTIILFCKLEKGKRRWLGNITLAMMINIVLAADLYNSQSEKYSFFNTLVYVLIVVGIMVLQVIYNLKWKLVRDIEYRVKVKTRSIPYKFQTKPRKIGNFYSAKMLDKDRKETKRVLIPESEIEKIEYIIKECVEE